MGIYISVNPTLYIGLTRSDLSGMAAGPCFAMVAGGMFLLDKKVYIYQWVHIYVYRGV